MALDRLFQYPGLVEPFSAAYEAQAEDITLDKWYVEPADVVRRKWPIREGGFFVQPFDLAEQSVQLDQWYVEPADVMRRRNPRSPSQDGWFALWSEPIENPPVPDLISMALDPAPPRRFLWPQGGYFAPVKVIPGITPFRIPRVPPDSSFSARERYTVDNLVDILNSLIANGWIVYEGPQRWDLNLEQGDIIDALGFYPVPGDGVGGGGDSSTPPAPLSGNIVTITDDTIHPPLDLLAQVNCDAPHGLAANDLITIAGTSHAAYNGLQRVDSIASTTSFDIQMLWEANSTGGTWTKM